MKGAGRGAGDKGGALGEGCKPCGLTVDEGRETCPGSEGRPVIGGKGRPVTRRRQVTRTCRKQGDAKDELARIRTSVRDGTYVRRWEGTVSGPNGDFQLVFNFHVDGSKLTGTVETPNGENPISDGKVDGDHLSFKTPFNDNDINHEGTVSGDTIDLKVEGPWGESDVTLKRAAKK